MLGCFLLRSEKFTLGLTKRMKKEERALCIKIIEERVKKIGIGKWYENILKSEIYKN